ncbi:MAG: HdeD family acid-resistance protein [Bdellovibrionales bacterium]
MNLAFIDWKWILARGLLALGCGVVAILYPRATVVALAFLFGIYVLLDGILAIMAGWTHRADNKYWWALGVAGLIGIAAGAYALAYPPIALLAMIIMGSVWAIAAGVVQIYAAVTLRGHSAGSVLLGIAGLISVLFGMAMAVWPGLGVLALVTMFAVYSLSIGVVLTLWSFKLKGARGATTSTVGYAAHAT